MMVMFIHLGDDSKECILPKEKTINQMLTVKVEVKGLEPFKRLISVMGEFVLDERIDESIRAECVNRIIRFTDQNA